MAEQLVVASEAVEAKNVKAIFERNMAAMVRSAPRSTNDPGRLIRIAFNAIVFDGKLVKCTQRSLVGGVMEAVKLGITLGGPMQEGWLIPFKNKSGDFEATLIVGYMGLRNIIDRGRAVIDMHPRAVYKNDEFDVVYGNRPVIKHRPHWMVDATSKPGDLVAVYAVARLRGGGEQLEVMPKYEVDQHRARSRAKDSGPWVSDYDGMALKTVLRKISKYLPKSSELLARALDLDDKADRGISQDFEIPPDVVFHEDRPKQVGPGTSKFEQLKTQVVAGHPNLQPEPEPTLEPAGDELSLEESNRLDMEAARQAEAGEQE